MGSLWLDEVKCGVPTCRSPTMPAIDRKEQIVFLFAIGFIKFFFFTSFRLVRWLNKRTNRRIETRREQWPTTGPTGAELDRILATPVPARHGSSPVDQPLSRL